VVIAQPIIKKLEARVKAWTKPATDSLVGGTAADLLKSKPELVAENAFLRQQVIVLNRQVTRPQLTAKDIGKGSSSSGGRNRRAKRASRV
jgi:hypothetical protein